MFIEKTITIELQPEWNCKSLLKSSVFSYQEEDAWVAACWHDRDMAKKGPIPTGCIDIQWVKFKKTKSNHTIIAAILEEEGMRSASLREILTMAVQHQQEFLDKITLVTAEVLYQSEWGHQYISMLMRESARSGLLYKGWCSGNGIYTDFRVAAVKI